MDAAFEAIGKNGLIQKRISLLIILVSPLISMISLAIPFMTQKPDFFCLNNDSPDFPFNKITCSEEEICLNPSSTYEKNSVSSLKNWAFDFNLYCERSYIIPVFGTLYFIGGFVGAIFLSPLADKYGRAKVYKFFLIVSFLLHLNTFLAFNVANLALICFLMGFIDYIYMFSGLIITEYLDRDKSGIIMSVLNSIFPLVGIAIALLFKIFNNWRAIFLITSLIALFNIYLSQNYFVESPRWLVSKGREEEAIAVLRLMAQLNGSQSSLEKFLQHNPGSFYNSTNDLYNSNNNKNKSEKGLVEKDDFALNCKKEKLIDNNINTHFENSKIKITTMSENSKKEINRENNKNFTIFEIMNFPSQRKKIINLCFIWSATVFCYFGLIFYLEKLGDAIISLSILIFVGEIISELSSGYLADKFGRVAVLKASFILGGAGFFLYSISPSDFLRVFFLFITSLGICAYYNVIYIYTPEVFPTSIRSTVLGNLYLVSRVGAFLIPSINSFFSNTPVLFALVQFAAAYVCFFLEESLGKEIEDTIPEFLFGN